MNEMMDRKTTGIVAYFTWIGFIIALCCGDKEGAKFHINQALVLNLFALLGFVPVLGQIWEIFLLVCWIIAIIGAVNEEEREIPLLGKIYLIK